MRSFTAAVVAALAGKTIGTVHHIFSGVFSGTDIYAIEFDDQANTLTLAANITSNADSSKWISIDSRKENIYVANGAQYDSYKITNSTGLEYAGTVAAEGSSCDNANYIIATTASPYVVFGASYSSSCPAQMMSVYSTGTLTAFLANATYGSTIAIHGLGLSSDNKFLYSADDSGNAIWVHSINITAGTANEIQYLAAPTGADPRHMVMHPAGNLAYVVFEALSAIGVYSRDITTGELTYTNTSYSLLPSGFTNTSSYWADEVQYSIKSSGTPS